MLEVSSLNQNKHVHHESINSSTSSELNDIIGYTTVYVDMLLTCSKHRVNYQQRLLPPLKKFIKYLYLQSKLSHSVLIVALIYLERLKCCLPDHSQGEFDTPYKMLIAAIILASKFIEDHNTITRSIYNLLSPLYNKADINEMEKSFLAVIKFSRV
ncbi:cyclin domain-containing protein [Backusella circina FSU 941]|nr:cyclin domain-containing protein [Backusella circina FSU 941]